MYKIKYKINKQQKNKENKKKPFIARLRKSFMKSLKQLLRVFPILLGVVLLVSLVHAVLPKSFFVKLFQNKIYIDPFIGSFVGSILAGNPVTSYIIGGEMLSQGISLMVVTAFIVSWVTVGIIQLPAEMALLGKRSAIIRNLSAFILSIIVAIITVILYNLL